MSPPLVVLRRTKRAANRIIEQHVRGALIFAPYDVVGRVNAAVVVVIARQTGRNNTEHAAGVKLTRVPSETAAKRGQYSASP